MPAKMFMLHVEHDLKQEYQVASIFYCQHKLFGISANETALRLG